MSRISRHGPLSHKVRCVPALLPVHFGFVPAAGKRFPSVPLPMLAPDYENDASQHSSQGLDSIDAVGHWSLTTWLAAIGFFWYSFVVVISVLGVVVVKAKNAYFRPVVGHGLRGEGVTILRPLKGLDTEMDICLSSAFLQKYSPFEIIFCVANPVDPAIAVAEKIIARYPHIDARIIVGESNYGPNPKINNLVKGYAEAKYDIVWVLDSNVWVSCGALSRSVAAFNANPRVHLVHHLPLCVSVVPGVKRNWGAKLDEMFLFTAHSKFYSAINFVAVAPCVMGKSNLYRRSALDAATASAPGCGLQEFARYIAEDNMIAECLWKNGGRTALTVDSAIQPLGNVPFDGYLYRRIRWLRVRKYMVMAATLVEPTTESVLCGVLGSFGYSVLWGQSSSLFSWYFFLAHLLCWCLVDYYHFHALLSFENVDTPMDARPYFTLPFYCPDSSSTTYNGHFRTLSTWFPVWLARELLALPIWMRAMAGHRIMWRNRPFRIKPDLTAEEIAI